MTVLDTTQAPEGVQCPANHDDYARMGHGACPYCRASLETIRAAFALSVPVNGQGSEPVAFQYRPPDGEWGDKGSSRISITPAVNVPKGWECRPLYAAQQAPISDHTQAGTDERSEGVGNEDAWEAPPAAANAAMRALDARLTEAVDHDLEALCFAMLNGVGCTPWSSPTWDNDGTDGASREGVRASVRRILSTLLSKPGEP